MKKTLSTLFGIGYLPGGATIASGIAVAMYWGLAMYYPQAVGFAIAVVFLASVVELINDDDFASTDPKQIVVDEWLGMYAALYLAQTTHWASLALLFVAFRVVDIFKPFPFNYIDKKLKSWWGLLVDDILIGIVIGILYRVVDNYLPWV